MSTDYSIQLDVLRALVADRRSWLSEAMAVEEAKTAPDAIVIAALGEQRAGLPVWATYPDEQTIDAEIDRWRTIVGRQRSE